MTSPTITETTNYELEYVRAKYRQYLSEEKTPDEVIKELRLQPGDYKYITALIANKIKFIDLPFNVRMALYKIYSGLPYDNDGVPAPELIDVLKNFIAQPPGERTVRQVYSQY